MRFLELSIVALCVCHIATASEKWSRQLEPGQIFNDWVPITSEAKSGKSLTFGDDLVAAAQTPFQFFAEPLNNRFNLQQQHPAHPSHTGAPAEVNSYISNNVPQFQFLNSPSPAQKQRTVQTFGGSISNKPVAEPLIQSSPNNSPFTFMQEVQRQPHVVHYQSQPISKNVQNSFIQQPPVPAFQFNQQPSRVPHAQKFPPPPPFQFFPPQQPQQSIPQPQQQSQQQGDDTQLLYVPFDSLYPQNQQPPTVFDSKNRYNILSQPPSASLINDFYSPIEDIPSNQISTKKQETTKRPTITPATASYKLTTPFETTSKLKPHQPPLSMFVANDNGKESTQADVLSTLKNSNTIDVMDSIAERSPKVFIGPSGMTAPDGYTKFELPYLSNIDGTRNERKIDQLPFFVAPLSYKTPPGFSKIPLPAPHVGSVVVNQPSQPNTIESNESSGFTPDNYYTKQPSFAASPGPIKSFLESNKPVKNSQTVKLTSGFHFTSDGNVQLISNEFTFPTLSPSTTLPPNNRHKSIHTTPKPAFVQSSVAPSNTPLTKVKANVIQELRTNEYSTHNPTTPRVSVPTRTRYDEFGSSPSQILRTSPRTPTTYAPIEFDKTIPDDYYKVKSSRPTVSSFEYQDKKSKKTDFNFKPIPEFNFESVTSKKPKIKTTTSTTTITPPTTEYKEPAEVSFPSSTPIPSPTFDYSPTVSIIENTDIFKQVHGDSYTDFSRHHSTPRPNSQSNYFDLDGHVHHPIDTAPPSSQSISQFDQFFNTNNKDENVPATENPNYNLPSELPPISAHLPGLVNSLMEEKWVHNNNVTEEEITTTTTTTTKRPRGRRPTTAAAQSTYRTASSDERKVTRARRPTTYSSRGTVSATESSIPSRTSPSRSSKIRYNITSDETSRFRTRQNRRPVKKEEEQNIEYQRDVLNQNYPSSIRPPTTVSTEQIVESIHIHTEVPAINDYNAPLESVEVIPLGGKLPSYNNDHTENIYTPDNPLYYENTIDTTVSPTLQTSTTHRSSQAKNHRYSNDDYQIPQHKTVSHRLKGNFNFNRNIDSFYNKDTTETPREDEILITAPITTEATSTTSTTTTTEVPETEAPVTRRTNFPRRRLYTTTPQPDQAEPESTESYANRSRGRKENVVVVKKIRARGRTTTSTETPETTRRTAVRNRATYNSNRNSYRERNQPAQDNANEETRPRFRIRENTQQRFRLDTQESQWSTRHNQNSFQPIDETQPKSSISKDFDDTQEIVTASPDNENDSYLINVTASVNKPVENDADDSFNLVSTTEREDDLAKRTKEEELDASPEHLVKEILDEMEKDARSEKKATKIEKKPGQGRRGIWRKVKKPVDGFETAETINIGNKLYNTVGDNDKKEGEKPNLRKGEQQVETTMKTVEESETTTLRPISTSEALTTTIPEATSNEPHTRMFDEARKAFTEYLSLEDDSDDAVNMEEADDKLLEALKDITTTAQPITTTEEPITTTTLPPTTTAALPFEFETTKSQKISKEKMQVKTSTKQKVTGEICFRGRCVKTEE